MLYLQSWHCRLLLIRNVKGEQQRIQQCSLNFCCLERMLHLLPSSSNFCFISLEQKHKNKKYRQNFNGKSPLCLSPFPTFSSYTLQITFCRYEINIRNTYSKSRIGKQTPLCSLESPMASLFKTSESWARANNLPSLSSSETTLRKAAAPGTPAVQSHSIIWEFRAAFRTLYK